MSTAEELVNRVRRKMREDDISTADDDLSVAILDEVNTAMVDVLESRIWDFDIRTAALVTEPTTSSTDANLTAGSTSLACTLDTTTNVTVTGDFTWRAVVTNASVHSSTPFRISGATLAISTLAAILDVAWPDTTIVGTGTVDLFVSEYQFPQHSVDGPSKVRQLLSMTFQQTPLKLVQVSREQFESIIVNAHYSLGQDPTVVYTGFDVIDTGTSFSVGTDYAPGFGIWPIPTNASRLDYTYVFAHPEITTTQDLENVPRSIEDQITWLAFSRLMQGGIGNQVQEGVVLEQKIWSRLDDIHRGQKRDPQRRIVVKPHSNRTLRDPSDFGLIPDDIVSL